jgi:protein-L-isoaspartate(D-aspartate) O-methyltransferase
LPNLLDVTLAADTKEYYHQRQKMVACQIQQRGIVDLKVLNAMKKVPRHAFVPEKFQDQAYQDHPIPIGEGQTISQPYIVALMTQSLQLSPEQKVLEIGTGSGYQTAVLAEIVSNVYSIEIRKKLFQKAVKILQHLGYQQVNLRHGDGYLGWKEAAPFDAIIITAAVDHIPPPLLSQLKNGGKLVLPLGNSFSYQNLSLVTKQDKDYRIEQIADVLFVPMTGNALEKSNP